MGYEMRRPVNITQDSKIKRGIEFKDGNTCIKIANWHEKIHHVAELCNNKHKVTISVTFLVPEELHKAPWIFSAPRLDDAATKAGLILPYKVVFTPNPKAAKPADVYPLEGEYALSLSSPHVTVKGYHYNANKSLTKGEITKLVTEVTVLKYSNEVMIFGA